MVHAFAIEVLWLFTRSEERHGFPSLVTVTAQPSHHQRLVFPRWLFGAHLSHLIPIPHLTVHLADPRFHSPTTLAYESITHTSFIGSTHAIYREADHAPTCPYRLPFPVCQLGSHNIALSHCFLVSR